MLRRVVETISRYNMFAPGQKVGVAVSGGADSVCLLHVLRELAPRWGLQLSVLHLDHGLRGEESDEDARFVSDLATRLALPFCCERAEVRRIAQERGENLEQAGREARREFFRRQIGRGLVDRVALGHTRSDQAETVLFRFLRGAGTAGLAGMRPVTPEGFVRPLLEIDRAEVERYLRERNIPWRVDSSNADPAFARNRIRHSLLPLLTQEWNPALAETLAHTACLARDEEDYWAGEIARLAAAHLVSHPPSALIRVEALSALPRAAARRLVRRAIEVARGDLRRIDFRHVEQVLGLAGRTAGYGRVQLPGVDVARSFEWIRFAPAVPGRREPGDYEVQLSVPGRYEAPGTGVVISLELLELEGRHGAEKPGLGYSYNGMETSVELDWEQISGDLVLRNWRPGDHYQPVGHSSEAKLKLLFQEARIPLWERHKWPIITSGGLIVWARRFGPAAGLAATPDSRTVLKIREILVDRSEGQ